MAQDLILAVPTVLVRIDKSIPSKQTFISGFRRNVDEICALLGYYAIPIRCPETSVNNYYTTPRIIPEERRSENKLWSVTSTKTYDTFLVDLHFVLH